MPGRIGVCPRNGIKKNSEVSIGEAARGIPRGGVSIGVVPGLPPRARRAIGLLAAERDSRCGSAFLQAPFRKLEEQK
jgi:hypothetical protein